MITDVSNRAAMLAALSAHGNEARDPGQIEHVMEMAQRDSVQIYKTTDPKGTWIHHAFSDYSLFSVLIDDRDYILMHQVGKWREEATG